MHAVGAAAVIPHRHWCCCLPLQGTLPATWVDGAWPNLTTLHLSGGGLSSVPSVWGLQALTQLDLSRNNLTGPLPAFNASGGTAQLQQLDFSNNALTGNLLAGLGATLPSLSVLLLSGNELSGTLPAEVRACLHAVGVLLHAAACNH